MDFYKACALYHNTRNCATGPLRLDSYVRHHVGWPRPRQSRVRAAGWGEFCLVQVSVVLSLCSPNASCIIWRRLAAPWRPAVALARISAGSSKVGVSADVAVSSWSPGIPRRHPRAASVPHSCRAGAFGWPRCHGGDGWDPAPASAAGRRPVCPAVVPGLHGRRQQAWSSARGIILRLRPSGRGRRILLPAVARWMAAVPVDRGSRLFAYGQRPGR